MIDFIVKRGYPTPGATVDSEGVNFSIFTRNGTKVTLELYENFYDEEPIFKYDLQKIKNKTGDVWHIYVKGAKHNMFYGWRIDGVYDPESGHRFNYNKLLIDPYARAISSTLDFSDDYIYGYSKDSKYKDLSFSKKNSAISNCKSIIIDESIYDWGEDRKPDIKMRDTIIYEMHVRLFTINANSEVDNRGTFDGIIQKLEHLKELGITSIELMPVFEFSPNSNTNINPLNGEALKDIWGYNPLSFFAVSGNYSYGVKLGEQVFQFKDFVKILHKNNFEIILDVVYNHTGEGSELGPTLSFRGVDNSIYYILDNNRRFYANYSGTGNTLNCSHSVVKQMILDSLRYWVTEMHVDGFRFDLAAILGRDSKGNWIGDLSLLKDIADDPILSGTKLIAEGWDAAGGYYVGEFPTGWAEWNGKFRDTVRRFVRGDNGQVGDLATRIAGSPDLFQKSGRHPWSSVNFITAHDGFTLWDLVSYNRKHNHMNGENNMDGANDNYSYNHGVEGYTDDLNIISLRKQQIKNFIVILMLSQGVPMILMGDEFCRTQYGNNNTYCQDNNISWVDWSFKDKNYDIFDFYRKMIKFRKNYSSLRRKHFFTGKDLKGDGFADITWHGIEPYKPDFGFYSHSLAFMINGEEYISKDGNINDDIYVALNSYNEPLKFTLPRLNNKNWYLIVDTSRSHPNDFLVSPEYIENDYTLQPNSSVIMIGK
ncbi:glycogen debranching protein GlgX [Oceanotoga sp. DSM 15011]|jgi:glycogen operon protein|uniref:glycogen debranching protein GlgX n=1 Tax=unclassified Oceanotoga TaxID=2618448 RepID=UPI0021F4D178|nr:MULTISPECIES: glycogen debranching protein GlgX [unclassified Oceanotoga]MDN5341507.1 isoamylase [Oceanotoga sp.]UYP00538.1 glycogen debranching protein GlgX [Oceanotoga sp. DSM 15011]